MADLRFLLHQLSTGLNLIKNKVNMEVSVNDTSLNVLLETTILKVYNIVKDVSLENANLNLQNAPGIDGIDNKNRIMAQVTSTFSNEKIERTINQVMERQLYKEYDRLIFLFLTDKKALSPAVVKRIENKIGGAFPFDLKHDIIDLKSIYQRLYHQQDIKRIYEVVTLLNEVIPYIPGELGLDVMSICFHDEELENVYELVNYLTIAGMNVYTSSKKLYNKFRTENHPRRESVLYASPELNLDSITFSIVVLSNSFVTQNFKPAGERRCPLFQNAVANDIKIETISFDRFLRKQQMITDKHLGIYSYVAPEKLAKKVNDILSDRKKEAVFSKISPDEIVHELEQTNKNFRATKVYADNDYILLNFLMEKQDDVQLNYVIINRDHHLGRLVDHYQKNFKHKFFKNLNVLVPRAFDQKTNRRLQAVKTGFATTKVYYTDEYLFDQRYNSLVQLPILTNKDFITPVVRSGEDLLGINDIIYWIYNNSDSSVCIINGAGGIGKTTISEKIHDTIIAEHERSIVLFISATQYIDEFRKKRGPSDAEYDLYNIFKACHSHANIIDQNSFYLYYALGNIIIIFDSVDEIISTIPSFSLQHFIEKLEDLRIKIGRGKILLNCRDSYIKDLVKYYEERKEDTGGNFQVYELLGFDEDLCMQYFNIHFPDEKRQRSCMKLLKEFYPDDPDEKVYKYPPFILEIVVEIVGSGFNYSEIRIDFNSAILQAEESNDVVIFRICNREISKKEEYGFHLEVDEQVLVFCYLALEEKGKIQSGGFRRILGNMGMEDRVEDVINGLKDHPLLCKSNGDFMFRFDFFNTYFKAVGIFNLISSPSRFGVTEGVINILSEECNFNSVLFKTLVQKINKFEHGFERLLKYTKACIKEIMDLNEVRHAGSRYIPKKAISNLLLVLFKSKREGTFEHSYIIKELFGDPKVQKPIISDFYFIDVPSTADVVLDFSGMIFTASEVNNYSNFFKCIFDENTYFDEYCNLSNVFSSKLNLKKITATLTNFDKEIKGDNSITKVLNLKDNKDEYVKYFKFYLKSFYSNRVLSRFKHIKEIVLLPDEFITVTLLTGILERNDIVARVDNNEVFLNEKYHAKVIKFLLNAFTFPELKKSIKELENMININYDTE